MERSPERSRTRRTQNTAMKEKQKWLEDVDWPSDPAYLVDRGEKKTKKPIKPKKPKQINREKLNWEKNLINLIRFFLKNSGSVWFSIFEEKTGKSKLNRFRLNKNMLYIFFYSSSSV